MLQYANGRIRKSLCREQRLKQQTGEIMTKKMVEVKSIPEILADLKAQHKALMKANPNVTAIWYEVKGIPYRDLMEWARSNNVDCDYSEHEGALRVQASAVEQGWDSSKVIFLFSEKGKVKSVSKFSGFTPNKKADA